ncbi:hypothetical protein B0O80DRAFT_496180 [Mortierella sp. GBAus27b]|nr:G patch domain and ankyrin repeat-containing protein 1 [Mortierella sp. GBA43]KAI8357411.1 hypothetical protein B0O80DRAFT_496180 [Mortierella sp. GBAus27b]
MQADMSKRNSDRNRTTRQDDSGTFYKNIVFVPSGTLAMKDTASTSQPNKQEDAVDVREFYKNVLAMPTTSAPPAKKRKVQSSRGRDSASLTTKEVEASSDSSVAVPDPRLTSHIVSSSTPSIPTSETTISAADEIVRRNWQSDQGSTRPVAKGHILCESCQIEVREDDLERHRQGTAHLMSQESPIKPLDTLKLGYENKGFRMLVNSGWDYEKGLGAEGQGARHPVATRLKHDRLALGAAGASKKAVTHTFEEIEKSRTKPTTKTTRRVPLNLEDYRRMAEKERRDRVRMMEYMKK